MNSRRYIGALIIVLTFLGVIYHQQNAIPNQEIIVEFADANLATHEAQNTITIVTKQLNEMGVHNIQVNEGDNGILKITYFSLSNVSSIKNKLSKEIGMALNNEVEPQKDSNNSPKKEHPKGYNLDVYQIHKSNHSDWDFTTNTVLKHKIESDRCFNPKVYVSTHSLNNAGHELKYTIALNALNNSAKAIDKISYKVPEVRAGPIS